MQILNTHIKTEVRCGCSHTYNSSTVIEKVETGGLLGFADCYPSSRFNERSCHRVESESGRLTSSSGFPEHMGTNFYLHTHIHTCTYTYTDTHA